MNSRTDARQPDVEPDYQIINERRRILQLLEEIMRERTLLTALLNGGRHAFSTAIVDIRDKDDALILDELMPTLGNDMMARGGKLWILGQLHGIKTAFQTDIRDSGIEDGIAYHRIGIPASVRHQQRRGSFRAIVSLGMTTRVHIKREDKTPLNGQLRDLSVGGMSVILPLLGEMDGIGPGTILPNCEVELPGQGRISTKAEIRHVHRDESQKSTHVGLAFRDLPPQEQRQLQRSVTHLEREQLRKKGKDE